MAILQVFVASVAALSINVAAQTPAGAGHWGQTCGGNGTNPVTCMTGLVCMTIKTRPDNSGVCVSTATGPFASAGQACMTNNAHSAICMSGFTCQPDGTGAGKCVEAVCGGSANLGDQCGGPNSNSAACVGGLVCQNSPTDGIPGICVPAPPGACGQFCNAIANAAPPTTVSSLGMQSVFAMIAVAASASFF